LHNIVTDLVNALPGNSSVNTVQHATIEEAVFSMSSAPSSSGTTGLSNPFLSIGSVTHFRVSGDVTYNRDGVFRGTNTPLMSMKQINIVLILNLNIHGYFGFGMHRKLFLTSLTFLQFNSKIHIHSLFQLTLHFHVSTKLKAHSDVTRYCSTNTERTLCKLASPNIPSNSVTI
jgi:hypothetical protein